MAQHKHHDLIVAWAKGAKIQVLSSIRGWIDCQEQCSPAWDEDCYYRIKTEPKPDLVFHVCVLPCKAGGGKPVFEGWNCMIVPITSNLKLVFDGETGVLKTSEVINDR